MTDQVECNCALNPDSHAETCPVYMQQRIEALRAEIEELDALRNRQSDLLSQTAIALRGPEPALTRYSHADIPSRVKAVVANLEAAQVMIRRLTTACSLEQYGSALHDVRTLIDAPPAPEVPGHSEEPLKMVSQANRIPAGLYAELEALRTLRDAVRVYRDSYMRDEIEDEDSCVSVDQHDAACSVQAALGRAQALEVKS